MDESEWKERVVRLAVKLDEAMQELEDYQRDPSRDKRHRAAYQFEVTSTLAHLRELISKRPGKIAA